MEPHEIVQQIEALEDEISKLRKEYAQIVPPCANTDCSFYDERTTGNCRWTHYVADCKDYIPEGGD